MCKKLIASCIAMTLAGGVVGGGVVAHAAATTAAIATGEPQRPLQLLISGQIGRLLTLRSELNISADQREQIKQILQFRSFGDCRCLAPVVEKCRVLRDAVAADTSDEQAIRAAANNLASSIGDAAVLTAKVRAEVAKVLTPDQRAKIAEFRRQSDQSIDRFLDKMDKPA